MTIRELVTRRPVTLLVGATLTVIVIGLVKYGWDFLLTSLPVPENVATIWYLINFVMSLIAFAVIWRNLSQFEPLWTWQEAAFLRGSLLMVFGSSLGYISRAFDEPRVSLGTPFFTIALVLLVQAALRPPERFEVEHGSAS